MKQFEVCLDVFIEGKWQYYDEYVGEQFDTIEQAKTFIQRMQWLLKKNERFIIFDYVNNEFSYAIENEGEIYLTKRR